MVMRRTIPTLVAVVTTMSLVAVPGSEAVSFAAFPGTAYSFDTSLEISQAGEPDLDLAAR